MKEIGKVLAVSGSKAIVELTKNENCEKCALCNFGEKDSINVLVPNVKKAKIDDDVEIISSENNYSKLIKFLYFLPIFFVLAGIIISLAFKNDFEAFAFVLAMVAFSAIIMAITVKYYNSRSRIVYIMSAVIKREETTNQVVTNEENSLETSENQGD